MEAEACAASMAVGPKPENAVEGTMMKTRTGLTTKEKLTLFRGLFSGLTHVYGTYDPRNGRVLQVKAPVTDEVLLRHLTGKQPYGVYLLMKDRIHALAVDFDHEDKGPPMAFVAAAANYGLTAYMERSKSKGYHVWMFFDRHGVSAIKARRVAQHVLNEIDAPETEIFPKQDRLDGRAQYGNFINAPLFGRLASEGRTVFLDPKNPARPHPDQWELLAGVTRILECALDEIIEINNLLSLDSDLPKQERHGKAAGGQFALGLAPCAQRMLSEGVSAYQRVVCFRLGLHLKKAGLSEDIAIAALDAWAKKNRPRNNKRILTHAEIIEQTGHAYEGGYRGCGCEDPAIAPFCDERCPLKTRVCVEQRPRRDDTRRRSM